jgi:2'-5' RNA ligase
VTILSPFLDSTRLDRIVHNRLAAICIREPAFEVELVAVRRWEATEIGPAVVWLEPQPAEPFTALSRAIWAAYPDCPPYGREDDDLEAHLTIAIDDPSSFDSVETEASRLVPFHRRATTVALLVEAPDGRWRTRRRFALGR